MKIFLLPVLAALSAPLARCGALTYRIDPITRYVHVSYSVPANAPAVVRVQVELRSPGTAAWSSAAVWRNASETAINLTPDRAWNDGYRGGLLEERLAAGLRRTLVWNTASLGDRKIRVQLRVRLFGNGAELAAYETEVQQDNSDVVLLNDWSKVLQSTSVSADPPAGAPFGGCTGGFA